MPSLDRNNKHLVTSLCFHAVILLVLLLGMDVHAPTPVIKQSFHDDIISAVVLGDTEKSKLLPQPIKQEEPPPPPVKKMPPVFAKASQPEESEASKKDAIALKAIAKRKKLAKQKALEEKQRKQRLKARAKKRLLAKKRARLKKQQRLLEDQFLADLKKMKKKSSEKKLAKKRLENKFQQTLKEQAEASMRQDLLDEELKLQAMKARQARGEVNKYKALILQAISEHWIVPRHANRKLYSELMIRLAPDGMVLSVKVTRSSGDPALDSSAKAAVLKASPLPVPDKRAAFESFRQFVLKVKPENIIR